MIGALRIAAFGVLLFVPAVAVHSWVGSAENRLAAAEATAKPSSEEVAVAAASDEGYCNPELKRILRRVLTSCGLISQGGSTARGCQPLEAKNVATVSGADFNALFQPMKDRGGILQFDVGKAELDPADTGLVDQVFSDQKGASYFFVVARASPEGSTDFNRELSRTRAESVLGHLRESFKDPDLDKEVGLLSLGEEFAQLDQQFCQWRRSSTEECKPEDINRSAFVAWIDCRL